MTAGSVDEKEIEQGIAHIVEHVTFLGSKKRDHLLGTGARSNAYTDFHHTVFHVHSPLVNTNPGDQTPMLPQVRPRSDPMRAIHSSVISATYPCHWPVVDTNILRHWSWYRGSSCSISTANALKLVSALSRCWTPLQRSPSSLSSCRRG